MKRFIAVALSVLLIPVFGNYDISAKDEFNVVVFDYSTGEISTMNIPSELTSTVSPPSDSIGLTRSIIGTDDRTQVNPNVKPYSQVVLVESLFDFYGTGKLKVVYSTGAMVAPDVVLTSAHSIYYHPSKPNDPPKQSARIIKIHTKQNGTTVNTTYYYPMTWTLPENYINTCDKHYDWSVIKLREPVGNTTGWFGYSAPDSTNQHAYVSGYPADEDKQFFQYCAGGTIKENSDYYLYYDIDTTAGQSGAPVFDNNYIIRGVHTDSADAYGRNHGCRITPWVYNTIEKMKNYA